jgi:uncharacterized RDD family membrane protein YckC
MERDLEYRLYKEELSIAPVSKRVLAFVLDKLLLALIVFAAMGGRFEGKDLQGVVAALNQAIVFTTVVEICYQAIFTKLYGATIGKMLLKIRVVDMELLDNPGWRYSFLRAAVRFLGETLFYLGFLWAFFDKYRQGWHDKAAKTLVLDGR